MTDSSPGYEDRIPQSAEASLNVEDLLQKLRRKEGTWVEWGQTCATLQKAGHNPQAIFEATGFEPIQQNQVIVGAQVFTSIVNAGMSDEVRSHFTRKGSDILYELRILTQAERAKAAEFIVAKSLDLDNSRDLARAMKEYSRYRTLPSGFENHPGDAAAYHYWKLAKQQADLQERSRLIARGLMFANSQTARQQIEQLLIQGLSPAQRPAPNWPFYRLEADEGLPRLIPVAGQFPLAQADLKEVPIFEETGPFNIVKYAGNQAWVCLPGWQVVLKAEDPVAIICHTSQLGEKAGGKPEDVLVLIDRSQRKWEDNSYFLVEQSGQLEFHWFEEATDVPLLGRVILVLRPKKIIDEGLSKDLWQIDE